MSVLRRIIFDGTSVDNIYSRDMTNGVSFIITLSNGRVLTLFFDPEQGYLYIDKPIVNWEYHNVNILHPELLMKYVLGWYVLQIPKEMNAFLESLKVRN